MKKDIPKVLEVCVDLDGGGIDRYLFNYCIRISNIHFDYVVVDNRKGMLEPLLEEKGSKIYRVPTISKNPWKYYQAIKSCMMRKNYDAVHVHLGHKSFIALMAAKRCGIKTRIVHAHIAFVPENRIKKTVRYFCTVLTKWFATDLCACGIDAAKWVWGEKAYNENRVRVINNAIETRRFAFSEEKRRKKRKELQITDHVHVIGHVGRISDQKNQLRLLSIFENLLKLDPTAILLMVGQGEMQKEVENEITRLNLQSNVKILGIRNDVSELLNAMDIFVFPSKYEGLPFTLIETQCNGLMSICSDSITELVKVSDRVEFVPLAASDDIWVEKIIEAVDYGHKSSAEEQVVKAGYSIENEVKNLKDFYMARIKNNGRSGNGGSK